MRILVAARTSTLTEALGQPLRDAGHEVVCVENADALRARASGVSAAFVTRWLPGGDPLTQRDLALPTILVSSEQGDRDRAFSARLAGFLPVPFEPADVLAAIGIVARERALVLVADDSPLVHRHVGAILEEAGYDLLHAHDGTEALALTIEHRPDLLVTDVEMPGMDGYQVCHEVKKHPATAHLPVMICSTLGEAADLQRGFDVGADDYLVKPVVAEDILARVRDLLAERALGGRERVLVVDDSPAIRRLVGDALSRQGFEVQVASDGKEALEIATSATEPFELLVTDYDMPRMTGFELVHALKREPATRELPVLMLTARDTRRDRAQMRAAGLTAYLVKPFSADKCVAMVERMLAERRLRAYKTASRLYVSEGTVKAAEAQADGELFSFRAEPRPMSVLFSDLAGFTKMSASMSASDMVELLNGYLDAMCPIIQGFGGDIDKFIGDAIMALFEESNEHDEHHAVRATRAAWEMQRALDVFNAGSGGPALVMRIGVNTGEAVRGDIGSRFVRRDYTAIGDTVNRAQRYEGKAPLGTVLVSQDTFQHLDGHLHAEPLEGIELKGIAEPVRGYVIVGLADEDEDDDW